MFGSKELDLCNKIENLGFGIMATRRPGNLASVSAAHLTQLQCHLSLVQRKSDQLKLFVRERYPNSFDLTQHLGPTHMVRLWIALFVQLTLGTQDSSTS